MNRLASASSAMRTVCIIVALALCITSLAYLHGSSALAAQGGCQRFEQTGREVCGRFLEYWQQNGGLAQQGYPISALMQERSDTNGQTYTVQYFERAVFEAHPQNQKPYDVLLTLVGVMRLKEKYPQGIQGDAATLPASKAVRPSCSPTNDDGRSPTYVPNAPVRSAVSRGHKVTGFVLSSANCTPISGARLEMWPEVTGDHPDLYRATLFTDKDGRYSFEGPVTNHIHMRISAHGYKAVFSNAYHPQTGQAVGTFDVTLAPEPACTLFKETGRSLCGPFLEYWQRNGGLAQQGYPITGEFQERSETDGQTYTVQYFERAVFELHPEKAAPNNVLLSLLGRFRHAAKYSACGAPRPAVTPTTPPGHISPGKGRWLTKAPIPIPRSEVAVAEANGKVYVLGGFSQGQGQAANEEYDPGTDRWCSRASLPKGLNHAGAAGVNGKIILVGGFLENGRATADTYEYDPITDKWRALAPMPTARGALGVTVLDGKVYAVGGRDNADVTANEVYDPATNTWAKLAGMPTARDHLGVVALGGKIYAVGGRFESFDRNTGINEMYDPKTNTWQARAPMPTPRSGIAAVQLQGYMLVFGGEQGAGTFRENEAYIPSFDSWTPLASMPTPRHGIGAAVVNNVIYIPSGGPTPGGSQTEKHEAFMFDDRK